MIVGKLLRVPVAIWLAVIRLKNLRSRTDFDNEQSQQRLLDIMKKMGIMHELRKIKC